METFEVDETRLPSESVDAYLERIAGQKLGAALRALGARGSDAVVLAADTVVVLGDAALGKPRDEGDAIAMLESLEGRAHEVKTRFAIGAAGDRQAPLFARTVTTEVHFRPLSRDVIERYVRTGEGRDKAGGYAIQGIGGFAVSRIVGSYSNVVGLPVCEVVEALESLGALRGFPFGPST